MFIPEYVDGRNWVARIQHTYRVFMPIRACLVRALHKLPVQSRPSLHSQKNLRLNS